MAHLEVPRHAPHPPTNVSWPRLTHKMDKEILVGTTALWKGVTEEDSPEMDHLILYYHDLAQKDPVARPLI